MASVEERYRAAIHYVKRSVAVVEWRGIYLAADPITQLVELYAGKVKTQSVRDSLRHVEARWQLADTESERSKIALEAELLADRVEEALPGAPQQRQRTNLYRGEQQKGTPPTSYYGEIGSSFGDAWAWLKDRAHDATDKLSHDLDSLKTWLLVGGSVVAGWKLLDYLNEREKAKRRESAGERRQLNLNLARAARDAERSIRRLQPLKLHLTDTELHTWGERDRAHVELRDKRTGQTIVEWRDDEVAEAIEDGFLPHFSTDEAVHKAAFDYAKHIGLIEEARDAESATRPQLYSIQLGRGELEALSFLRGRYESARMFVDGLRPLDDSADRALGGEYDRGSGLYRFQISAANVRRALRATRRDGGDYGAIPNLRSDSVAWVLAQEREWS